MTDRHDYAISAIRFISMLMIITCHFMQYLEIELAWWFNVGVQIFFVISGFLYGGKSIEKPVKFYVKAFKKLLVPYWIFVTIIAIIHKLFVPAAFSWGKLALALLCVERLPGIEHLWFVQKILICYLLLPLLLLIKKELIEKSSAKAVVCTIFVFILLQFAGFTFNGYAMSANNINCFVVGIFLAGVFQKTKSLLKPTVVFCIAAVLMNTLRIYFCYIKGIKGNLFIDLFVKYAHGVLGIALFLVLYKLFQNIKANKLLHFSDKYSYHIYLVHQVYILGPLTLMGITPIIGLNIAIICSCILVSGIALKILNNGVDYIIKQIELRYSKEIV